MRQWESLDLEAALADALRVAGGPWVEGGHLGHVFSPVRSGRCLVEQRQVGRRPALDGREVGHRHPN